MMAERRLLLNIVDRALPFYGVGSLEDQIGNTGVPSSVLEVRKPGMSQHSNNTLPVPFEFYV